MDLSIWLWLAFGGGIAILISVEVSHGRARAAKARKDLPAAKIVAHGHSTLRTDDVPAKPPVSRGWRVLGWLLITIAALPVLALKLLEAAFQSGHHDSKGRLLRLRGKAALPERADGDGWRDDARPALDGLDRAERAALAEAWLASARMEHASIAAFSLLSLHLAALGAPSELVERTHRAALDEIRHARRCYAFASAYAGEAWTAGPIVELRAQGERPIDLVRLAVGSLVDGCVAEGIAADVVARAAAGAEDPAVRATLTMIARDETRHAELAWSVLEWCRAQGGEPVRRAIEARAAALDDEVAPPAPELAGVTPARRAALGLLDQDTLGAIATARIAAVRARALDLACDQRRAA
jgi:hypothetical protein